MNISTAVIGTVRSSTNSPLSRLYGGAEIARQKQEFYDRIMSIREKHNPKPKPEAEKKIEALPVAKDKVKSAIKTGHKAQIACNKSGRASAIIVRAVVAGYFDLLERDLIGSSRARHIVRPRFYAMYFAYMLTERSLPEIGRLFGGRDHTTVLNAVRTIRERVAAGDRETIDTLTELRVAVLSVAGIDPYYAGA